MITWKERQYGRGFAQSDRVFIESMAFVIFL